MFSRTAPSQQAPDAARFVSTTDIPNTWSWAYRRRAALHRQEVRERALRAARCIAPTLVMVR